MEETYTVTRAGLDAVRERLESLLGGGDEAALSEYEGAYGVLEDLGLVAALDEIAVADTLRATGASSYGEAVAILRERVRELERGMRD